MKKWIKSLHAISQSESCYYNGVFVKAKSGSGIMKRFSAKIASNYLEATIKNLRANCCYEIKITCRAIKIINSITTRRKILRYLISITAYFVDGSSIISYLQFSTKFPDGKSLVYLLAVATLTTTTRASNLFQWNFLILIECG